LLVGVAVAASAVAAITALIFPLREISPAESTGVAYLVAVLLVSTIWGLRLGLLTSVASAAAFNFFHLPPTGRFTIAEGRHWVALGTFLVAGRVLSRRALDAALRLALAEGATLVPGGPRRRRDSEQRESGACALAGRRPAGVGGGVG
jgi:two-component system sensor histidine kinase KdpD